MIEEEIVFNLIKPFSKQIFIIHHFIRFQICRLGICVAYLWAQLGYKGKQLFGGRLSIARTKPTESVCIGVPLFVLLACTSLNWISVIDMSSLHTYTCTNIYGLASIGGEFVCSEMISGQLWSECASAGVSFSAPFTMFINYQLRRTRRERDQSTNRKSNKSKQKAYRAKANDMGGQQGRGHRLCPCIQQLESLVYDHLYPRCQFPSGQSRDQRPMWIGSRFLVHCLLGLYSTPYIWSSLLLVYMTKKSLIFAMFLLRSKLVQAKGEKLDQLTGRHKLQAGTFSGAQKGNIPGSLGEKWQCWSLVQIQFK